MSRASGSRRALFLQPQRQRLRELFLTTKIILSLARMARLVILLLVLLVSIFPALIEAPQRGLQFNSCEVLVKVLMSVPNRVYVS